MSRFALLRRLLGTQIFTEESRLRRLDGLAGYRLATVEPTVPVFIRPRRRALPR